MDQQLFMIDTDAVNQSKKNLMMMNGGETSVNRDMSGLLKCRRPHNSKS